MSTPRQPPGPIHFADLVDREGDVVLACAPKRERKPRWTMIRHHVTCSECRAILRARPVRPAQRRLHNGLPANRVVDAELIRHGATVVSYWKLQLECGHTLPCHRAHQRPGKPIYTPRYAGCPECGEMEQPR